MNRFDELFAVARDIASNVHADPVARDAMANDLIKLCGLMIQAAGKGVAVDGESAMNDAHNAEAPWDDGSMGATDHERAEFEAGRARDVASAHTMYLTGERIQDGARYAVEEATSADLERYTRPVWQHVDRRPEALRVCGPCDHKEAAHDDAMGCLFQDEEGLYCPCKANVGA